MDYFKHYSTASRSNLLNHLLEEMGPAGYAYWFLLLELCAECWDGEGLPKFRFHTRILRQKLRISQTKLEVFLGFCQGFGSLSFHFDSKWIDLDIPKLAEVKTSRKLIKSNKNLVSVDKEIDTDKEKDKDKDLDIELESGKKVLPKNKVSKFKTKSPPETSPLAFLFKPEDPIQNWLMIGKGIFNAQTILLEKYSHHVLAEEVMNAFLWQCERVPRGAGRYLVTWMSNKKPTAFNPKQGHKTKTTVTPDNPTGNPFKAKLAEIRNEGKVS